jgi:hypothetical protein
MSTHYDRLPTLEERVRASKLIVTGRVKSIDPLPRTRIGEIEEEQAVAHIAIDSPLRGRLAEREIDVRFVSSRGDNRGEPQPFTVDQRLVLLLVPDVGRDVRPNTYIAYLRGAFLLTANAFTIETGSSPKGRPRKVRVSLGDLRETVKKIEAEDSAERKAWTKFEPQLARRPALPVVSEIPDVALETGPTSAHPNDPATPRSGSRN